MTIYGIRDHVTVGSEGKGQGNPVEFRDFARPDVETRAQSARLISKGYREHRSKCHTCSSISLIFFKKKLRESRTSFCKFH